MTLTAESIQVHVHTVQWPLWVSVLLGLPTVIAFVVLVVVLLRDRRKRPRA